MKPRCVISVTFGYEFEVERYKALLMVMPNDTKIIRAGMDYDVCFMMRFMFESDKFPKVEPGTLPPNIEPIFHTDQNGNIVKVELNISDDCKFEVEGPALGVNL